MILKVVVAGGFGVGKTTLVGAVSEIAPVRTEERMTTASIGVDQTSLVPHKSETTVGIDYGRITFEEHFSLALYGLPGQRRFWFMWEELERGAVGAIVLVDTRRMEDSWPAVDWYEQRGLPFVIAVNEFDGSARYSALEVREALSLSSQQPVIRCDARSRGSVTAALRELTKHALNVHAQRQGPL